MLLLQAVDQVRGDPIPERVLRARSMERVTVGLQSFDVPTVPLHEEPMQDVARGLMPDVPGDVLRESGVEWEQGLLELLDPRPLVGGGVCMELCLQTRID